MQKQPIIRILILALALAIGCNIDSYFSVIPQIAVNGWLLGSGLLIRGYLRAKSVMRL